MKKIINSVKAPGAVGPYSQAVTFNPKECNTIVYTSGQLPINKETGIMPPTIEEQTTQSLINVIYILEENGMTLNNVIKTTVYLSDINNFSKMNGIYSEFFVAPFPARSAFEVAELPLGALVEIEVVAVNWY